MVQVIVGDHCCVVIQVIVGDYHCCVVAKVIVGHYIVVLWHK